MLFHFLKTKLLILTLAMSTWMGNSPLVAQQTQIVGGNKRASQDLEPTNDGNLVKDSGFKSKGAWRFNANESKGAAASIQFEEVAKIDVTKGGESAYSVQLFQNGIRLEADQTYRLSFRTKAKSKTHFSYRVLMAGKPHTAYCDLQRVDVDDSWQTVTCEFTMNQTGDPISKLTFNLGQQTETLYIDDVLLVDVNAPKKQMAANDPIVPEAAEEERPFYIVKHLEKQIASLTDEEQKLDPVLRQILEEQNFKLQVAQYIDNQVVNFERTVLSKEQRARALLSVGAYSSPKAEEDAPTTSNDDCFVIAKIKLGSNSNAAEFAFDNIETVEECTSRLYYFAKATPPGAYRDYRIIGRFPNSKLAEAGVKEVRRQYDAEKKYQAQMLAYIKRRAKEAQELESRRRRFGGGGIVTSARRT